MELSRIILCMRSANERWHYIVTSSLTGWAPTQNNPWIFAHENYIFVQQSILILHYENNEYEDEKNRADASLKLILIDIVLKEMKCVELSTRTM